jgi:hypothetical protein
MFLIFTPINKIYDSVCTFEIINNTFEFLMINSKDGTASSALKLKYSHEGKSQLADSEIGLEFDTLGFDASS